MWLQLFGWSRKWLITDASRPSYGFSEWENQFEHIYSLRFWRSGTKTRSAVLVSRSKISPWISWQRSFPTFNCDSKQRPLKSKWQMTYASHGLRNRPIPQFCARHRDLSCHPVATCSQTMFINLWWASDSPERRRNICIRVREHLILDKEELNGDGAFVTVTTMQDEANRTEPLFEKRFGC